MSGPKVVVVGNGMAGSRVVEGIRSIDRQRLVEVTVLGAESRSAYNRVLLSEVLAGRHRADDISLSAATWHSDNHVTLRLGTTVTRIDREAREVATADGERFPYDSLILATGSTPFIPPVAGLRSNSPDGGLVPGAHVFRTIEDCDAIQAAAATARRAVVLGGGLLGIEAARGLAGRGIPVVIVHLAPHLMERQLDHDGGRVLVRALSELGVTVRIGVSAESIITDAEGNFGGVALADGSCVLGDLLVVATGVRAEVSLASDAGLAVGTAVVVDDRMRSTTDPRVFAIGECAEHRGSVYGLVAPAWEQAAVVVAQVTGSDPQKEYRGSKLVTRLKAKGVDLASMGDPHADSEDLDFVHIADASRGTYAKVILRDERIVGAIVLGQIAGIGTLTNLFDRGAPMPHDRLALLLPVDSIPTMSAAQSPAAMPGAALVCRCNGVTKSTIQACVLGGSRTVQAVADATRATTGCGGCTEAVCGIVDWLNAAEPAVQDEPMPNVPPDISRTAMPELEEVS